MSLFLCLFSVWSLSPIAAFADSAPGFSLSLTNASPAVDDTFQVKVNGANLIDLYAYEVNLTYDASRLQFVRADSGNTGFAIAPILKDNAIQVAHTQIGGTAGRNGSATLATLTFKAIGGGNAEVKLSSLKLVNSQLAATVVSSSAYVIAAVGSGQQSPTPEATPTTIPTPTATSTPTPTPTPTAAPASTPAATPASTPAASPGTTPTATPSAPPFFNGKISLDAIKAIAQKSDSVQAVAFKDVPDHSRYAKSIALATKFGIVKGYADGLFRADASVTRAEFASMFVKALGLEPTGSSNFKDVGGHWAEKDIKALKSNGIINGYLDGSFKPNQIITRAEIASMLSSIINATSSSTPIKFNDVSGGWAERAIGALADSGIIKGNGDGAFRPQAHATRLESLLMIMRMLNMSLGLTLDIDV